jgi:PAS domain S-box-containing protein
MAMKIPSGSVVATKAQVITDVESTSTHVERRAVNTRQAEEAQAILAAIVESSEDAIISKDLNGIIQSWNEAATRIFGYTAEETIGRPVTILMPAERKNEEPDILDRIRHGERVEHYETVRQRKDGTLVDISLTISPVRDRHGDIIGASKIARDISRRKQAEEALRRTEKLAATGRLAATMAHEINNPLESITNLLYLVQKESMSPVARQHLELVEQEIDRVVHVAKQTLGFYRDSAGKDWVNISQVVSDVLEIYGYKFRSRDVKVQSELDDSAKVFTAAGEFRQVFSNLFINAVDALPKYGGRVRVRVRKTRDWADQARRGVRVTLGDTGSGIGAEQMAKIFEPFYTTKQEVGTGLGLWLSKNIVEKHGGKICLRSRVQPGKSGTVFTVFWPEATDIPEAIKDLRAGATKRDEKKGHLKVN